MPNEKVKQLHQNVVEAIVKVKSIEKEHVETEKERFTHGEKFADVVFRFVGSWTSIALFILFVAIWVAYNSNMSGIYLFDPYPFSLLTFMLAGIAAIQAPIIMMSQHSQSQKNGKRLASNLKIDNEILSLHQSITVLMELQLQQVHENQLTTIRLLKELHIKADDQTTPS